MDFGKLPDITRVDFSMPPDPARNAKLLAFHERSAPLRPIRVHAGAPVWSRKEWVGRIYPLGARSQDFLKFYSRQFNTVELNATHYRIPDEAVIRSWREMASPGFKFCPKFPQIISHDRQLQGVDDLTREFCSSVQGLGELLGASFLQLPPFFAPAQLPALRAFLDSLPRGFETAVEFRHPGWFSRHELRPDALRVLENAGATALITDVAGRRDVLHMNLTSPRVMIRFVGNLLHSTDYSRVDAWVTRLGAWIRQGLQEIYFFVHQPDDVLAPDLIRYFIQRMNEHCGTELPAWSEMDQGRQLSLFG